MAGRTGTVVRAFELARSGEVESVQEIEKALISEDYEDVLAHMTGPLIRAQLRGIIAQSTKQPA